MEEERREHVAKMKKMEMEMEQVFEMKVKEKVQKLKDSEAEVIKCLEYPWSWTNTEMALFSKVFQHFMFKENLVILYSQLVVFAEMV